MYDPAAVIRSLLLVAIAGAAVPTPAFVFDTPSATPHTLAAAETKRGVLLRARKRPLRLYRRTEAARFSLPLGRPCDRA
jgi:hypothetical protein